MGEDKKDRGFADTIKDGLGYIAQKILVHASPPITEVLERTIRKIFSFAVIGFGAIFMLFALFFFLKESLGWSNSAASFSIGILLLAAGLLLKWKEKKV